MYTATFTSFIVCLGFIGMLALIVALVVGLRYLSYRETLALAEKGLTRSAQPGDGKGALRAGIVVAAIGLAFTCGLWPLGWGRGSTFPLGLGPWMLVGFLPLFFGLGLILIHFLTYKASPPAAPQAPEPPAGDDLPTPLD